MKKILSVVLAVCLLLSFSVLGASAFTNEYGDYVIFADGEFKNGGSIVDGCGTIIDENGILFGGEGVNNGEVGSGSFEIKINDLDSDDIWKEYKYLRVTCAMDDMGDRTSTGYTGGTVQFGKGNIYNFDQIELNGKTIPVIQKMNTYLLDLSKVSEFNKNNLIFSHAYVGYRVEHLSLTNNATYDISAELPEDQTPPEEPEYIANDYAIFADGEFKNGGSIIDGCGTIIDENGILFGGEGVNNGEVGNGSFEIKINDLDSDDIWKEYKYLRVTCAMDNLGVQASTGAYHSGTVRFGTIDVYNFDQIELNGKTIPVIQKMDTYLLDLSKVSEFNKNNLIFSHAYVGYRVKHIALTNNATYELPGDLYISAVGFSASVNAEGDSSTIGATVRNLSENKVDGVVEVEYYVDGKLFETVQKEVALEQGQAINIVTSKEYEVPFGSHRITAEIKEKTKDIDSKNNTLKTRFVIEE